MKHLRTITMAKASATPDPYLVEILMFEIYNRLIDFFLYNVLGLPEREPDTKES